MPSSRKFNYGQAWIIRGKGGGGVPGVVSHVRMGNYFHNAEYLCLGCRL